MNEENYNNKSKDKDIPLLCKFGIHRYGIEVERTGYVDCGDYIVCLEETWVRCKEEKCKKRQKRLGIKPVTFKKGNQ